MNTIPKLKIHQTNLNRNIDFKDIMLNSSYDKLRFSWNSPNQLEIVGIDCALCSDFSTTEEFYSLSKYYKSIIDSNKEWLSDLSIPLIFIINSFDMHSERKTPWLNIPRGFIFIPETIYINKKGYKKLITINNNIHNFKYSAKKSVDRNLNPKLKAETSLYDFSKMIEKSIKMMNEKKISKIVLSRQKNYDFDFNINKQGDFLSKAKVRFPNCINFLYDFKDLGVFFGVSPETLFKTNGDTFYSEALAGTIKSNQMLDSIENSKEFEEHKFVVDYINDKITSFSNKIHYNKKPHLK